VTSYARSEERIATKQGDVITAVASHGFKPGGKPKLQTYRRAAWDDGVAAWFEEAADGAEVAVIVNVTSDSQGSLSLRDRSLIAAVSTPTGLKAAVDAAGGFVNPYTFVPTPPRGDLLDGPGATGLGDSGPAGPPSHSLVSPGEWSGTLTVRFTTLTPLLLPDTEDALVGPDKRLTFRTRRTPDGRPSLPGTSLKGALRSAYETVTASRYGVLSGHDQRLAYRIPAEKGPALVPAVVEDDPETGGQVFRLCQGDRRWTSPGSGSDLVQSAAWVPAYQGQERHLQRVGGLTGSLADWHGRPVAARLRLYRYQSRNTRFLVWRVTHLAPDLGSLASALESLPLTDPKQPSGSLTLLDGEARLATGRLCVTGNSIGSKHDERFFVETDDDVRVPVTSGHLEFWQSVLDAYTAAKEYNTIPDGLQRSRHVEEATSLRKLPTGTLVHVETGPGNPPSVTGIHPVMIGRMPFDRPPASLLDASLRPAARPEELSPADRLFGWAPVRRPADEREAHAASGYRGRLAVRSIRCLEEGNDAIQTPLDDGVVLAPLSSPKPTQFRFYAASDDQGTPVAPRVTKGSGYAEGGGLRGRKHYRWATTPDGYWDPSGRALPPTADGRPRHREYLDRGAPASQTTRHRDWVRPGVTFEADVFIDAVPAAELGALLWLLDRGDAAPLHLGAGKPHGFGVLAMHVDWSSTRLWDGADVAVGWRSLTRPAAADPDTLKQLAAAFEQAAARHPVLAEAIASYRRAVEPVTRHPVHYPRKSAEPEPESYLWFVANERTRGGGVERGWALPHVRDQEQRLPYLDGDSDAGAARAPGRPSGPRPGGGRGRGQRPGGGSRS